MYCYLTLFGSGESVVKSKKVDEVAILDVSVVGIIDPDAAAVDEEEYDDEEYDDEVALASAIDQSMRIYYIHMPSNTDDFRVNLDTTGPSHMVVVFHFCQGKIPYISYLYDYLQDRSQVNIELQLTGVNSF